MNTTLTTIAAAIAAITGAAGLWYKIASWVDPSHAMEKAIERNERGDRIADHLVSIGEHDEADAQRKAGRMAVLASLERPIVSREHWWWAGAIILTLLLLMVGLGLITFPDRSHAQILVGVYSIAAAFGLGVLCIVYGCIIELIVLRRAEKRYQDRATTTGPELLLDAAADDRVA